MATDTAPASQDAVATVSGFLTDGSEVVRSAASQALAVLADSAAAPALVSSLLDEDPDVRVDAMAALEFCARASDGDTILQSLVGDPETDVKASAIRALARLRHLPSLPVIADLAKDRCEDKIAWQADTIGWDDWNDVQPVAVRALGEFASEVSVSVLLEIHSGDWGQELEPVLFAALAKIPGAGVQALIDRVDSTNARTRARALKALANADPGIFATFVDRLTASEHPEVRALSVRGLTSDSEVLAGLALRDPDVSVRAAALLAVGPDRPDIAFAALADDHESIRADALQILGEHADFDDPSDLIANVEVWARTGGPRLSVASVEFLSICPGPTTPATLMEVAQDASGHQQTRVAAMRALASHPDQALLDLLRSAIVDPARQIRLAALAAVAELARAAPPPYSDHATDLLCRAMAGEIDAGGRQIQTDAAPGDDAAAPKMEDVPSGKIAISPDGDIIEADDAADRSDGSLSTLASIQAAGEQRAPAPAKKRGKRVAVDGPDDVNADIPLLAFSVAADCPDPRIALALANGLNSQDPAIRLAAFEAVANRSESQEIEQELLEPSLTALGDDDPVIRGRAAHALVNASQLAPGPLQSLATDPDPLVRAVGVRTLATADLDVATEAMGDPAPQVRAVALDGLLALADEDATGKGLARALSVGAMDSLADAANRSALARRFLLAQLRDDGTPTTERSTLLLAIAKTDTHAWHTDTTVV